MNPETLGIIVGVLVFGPVVLWALLRDAGGRKKQRRRSTPAEPQTPHQQWRAALRIQARALGLVHVEQQKLFDYAHGTVGGLDIQIKNTKTIISGGGDAWPRFRRRDSGDGPGVRTGDAAFDGAIYIDGSNEAHRGALGDPALRELIRHLVLDLELDSEARRLTIPRMETTYTSEAIGQTLEPLLRFARWLQRPHAPLLERGIGRPALHELGEVRDEKRRAMIHGWLADLGPSIAAGDLVARQDAVEWRARLGGYLFRIRVDDLDDVTLELKVPHETGDFALSFDPSVVPEAGASDAWDDVDETVVFVGPGVFFDGESSEVEAQLSAWSRLAGPAREQALETMRTSDLGSLSVEGAVLGAEFREGLPSMQDPEGQLRRASSGLADLGAALAALPARPSDAESSPPWQRAQCRYCRVVFVWNTKALCPNCGAAVREAR